MERAQVRFILRYIADEGAVSIKRGLDKSACRMERRWGAFVEDVLVPRGPALKTGRDLLRQRSEFGTELGIYFAQFNRVSSRPLQDDSGQRMLDPFVNLASRGHRQASPKAVVRRGNVVCRGVDEIGEALNVSRMEVVASLSLFVKFERVSGAARSPPARDCNDAHGLNRGIPAWLAVDGR